MTKNIYFYAYILLLLARLFSVFTIVQYPIITWTYVYFLDLFDYGYSIRGGINFKTYNILDKSLDLITRLYLLYAGYFIGGPYIILVVMVLYRFIGDFLLAITHDRKFLFFFPNLIEFFFPLYVIYVRYFLGNYSLLTAFFVISFVLKMINEYLLHIKNWIDPNSLAYLKKHPKLRKVVGKR